MRRLHFLLFVLVVSSLAVYGQVTIDNFDYPQPDSAVSHWLASESPTRFTLTFDPSDKVEGAGAVIAHANIGAIHQWGSFAQFGYTVPADSPVWDWSLSDSVSLWLNVRMAPTHPEWMVFRISIADQPNPSDPKEEYIYENAIVIDNATSGWYNLRVPLLERVQTGTDVPDSTGFILAPTSWGGFTYNNHKLDRSKIMQWSLAIVTSGWDPVNNLPEDSIEVAFDKFERFGNRAIPAIIFNGKVFPSYITNVWAWGQSSASVVEGKGPTPQGSAIKWVQGDEYGNGWTGWGVDVSPGFNLVGGWVSDSLKFKMKTDTGVGALRAQFESASGKKGYVFDPIADTMWHSYAFALKDFVVKDGAPNFDSTNVIKFGIMAEATGKVGKTIYITELWTGNPDIDVIPPEAPTNLFAAGSNYVNVITWNDVPNEPGIRYNVYFSENAWTDLSAANVQDVPPYNLTSALANHSLRAPNVDADVTYYYGVVAKDAAGNVSVPTILSTSVTTTAKGVPTISWAPPSPFAADGDLSEWAAIKPFDLSVVSGTAHAVPNNPINDDADLHVKAYLAVDAQNLYVAFDVDDDVVAVDTNGSDYLQDCPDLFIGLYDWQTKHHNGYLRGATPDYHLRFSKNRIRIDNSGGATLMQAFPGNPDYIWTEKIMTSGYVVEARIPFTLLAAALTGQGDQVFTPVKGMRIPMDFAINDRDNPAAGGQREGIMCYSAISNDNSYTDMFYWTYSWIADQPTGVPTSNNVPIVYALDQNFPNPFNPSTQIRYSIAKAGTVSLKVFDVLGREVATLVNSTQPAGHYTVTFGSANSGHGLSSGVYFYRLESGSFVAVHKMVLLK